MVAIVGFLLWSLGFLARSSFRALDGNTYFGFFDDALISMRYGWNLSHGFGLVWNPGERVEGYTNLLMTLIMAAATWLMDKRIAVLAIRLFGELTILGLAWVTLLVADRASLGASPWGRKIAGSLAFLGVLGYYPLVYWTLLGMETGLLSLWLTLATLLALPRPGSKGLASPFGLGTVLGLAYLTRPDALVVGLPILALYMVEARDRLPLRSALGRTLVALGVLGLFIVGQQAFRVGYYGEAVPNTYQLKISGIPLSFRLPQGAAFLGMFMESSMGLIVAVIAVSLLFAFQRRKLSLLLVGSSIWAYQIWIGGEPWSYWRILSITIPILMVLFSHEITELTEVASRARLWQDYLTRRPILSTKQVPTMVAVLAMAAGLAVANRGFLKEVLLISEPSGVADNRRHVDTALVLRQVLRPSATVGVIWAGTIPYYSGFEGVDFLGKVDPTIARLPPDLSGSAGFGGLSSVPGHNKYDLNISIRERMPTFVQTFAWGKQDLNDWGRTAYERVRVQGVTVFLLHDSDDVRWDLVDIVGW